MPFQMCKMITGECICVSISTKLVTGGAADFHRRVDCKWTSAAGDEIPQSLVVHMSGVFAGQRAEPQLGQPAPRPPRVRVAPPEAPAPAPLSAQLRVPQCPALASL